MIKYLLPNEGTFYKANLHCHSTYSDGRNTPEEIKEAYKARGYSIVAYTDHDVFIPHPELADKDFLPLHGYEIGISENEDEMIRQSKCCHICLIALEPDNYTPVCWHRSAYLVNGALAHKDEVKFDESLPDYVRSYDAECINDMVRLGKENGFFVTYNHPAWSFEDHSIYSEYKGFDAMEMYNFTSYNAGFEDYNARVYDEFLMEGKRLYCIGADDNHTVMMPGVKGHAGCFGAWTVIKAESLDYRTVTKALKDGHFYASMGPEIRELYCEDGVVTVKCSDARKIVFTTGTRKRKAVFPDGDAALNEASFKMSRGDVYVRITVTDREGYTASSNAYFEDEILD